MKKIIHFVSIGSFGILLVALLWYNWPQKQEDRFRFLPADSLLYGQLDIDWNQQGPAQLFDVFWQKLTAANPQLNNKLLRKVFFSVLPQDILFSLTYDQEYARLNKQPDYNIIVNFGKKTRLLNLATKITSSGRQPGGVNTRFKIINNLVIISSANFNNESLPAEDLSGLRTLLKFSAREQINIYIPNQHGKLSSLVRFLEVQNSFAFFPAIGSVEYVQLSGNLVTADLVKGKLSFTSRNIADVDKISLDAFFLNNLLMRLLLGYNLTYEGEASSLANFVEINYQVKELNKLWQQVQ